jgi:hypothetical protein
MNTKYNTAKALGLGSLLVLALNFTAPLAHAGPGIDAWRGVKHDATVSAPAAASQAPAIAVACADSTTVTVNEVQHRMANGKGPLSVVATGTKRVCHSCGGSVAASTPAWPNGKGPLVTSEVKASHLCDTACAQPKS